LEDNYRTFCALNNKEVEEDLDIKEKVAQLLIKSEFADKRSAKLSMDDFLSLLDTFNKAGIHLTA